MGNDISNGTPNRVMVHIDVITRELLEEVRKFWLFKKRTTTRVFDPVAISMLWQFSMRNAVVLELVSYDMTEDEMAEAMEDIDRLRAHPFRTGIVYPDVQALVSELAYRQDIVGVIDMPERGLRYGGRWIDLTQV